MKFKLIEHVFSFDRSGIYFGLLILIILLLANALWFTYEDQLINEGPADSPPQIKILQSTLYTPDISQVRIENNIWSGIGGSENRVDLESSDTLLVQNYPLVSIPSNSKYFFKPNIGLKKYTGIELSQSPKGMNMTNGVITWEPSKNQIGSHKIAFRITAENSRFYEASYDLEVTKDFFPLGTNTRGQSLSGLLVAGSKWSLLPGLISATTAIFFGLILGVYSAFYGGIIGHLSEYLSQMVESIPALIIIFIIAVATQFNMYLIMLGVGIVLFPKVFNSIKPTVEHFIDNQFVESASEIGLKNRVVLWREIVWYNCKSDLISLATYCFAFAVLIEVTISYLNLGVQVPQISWGLILLEGRSSIADGEYWMVLFPAIAITATILGFTLLGAGAKKLFDPRFK